MIFEKKGTLEFCRQVWKLRGWVCSKIPHGILWIVALLMTSFFLNFATKALDRAIAFEEEEEGTCCQTQAF